MKDSKFKWIVSLAIFTFYFSGASAQLNITNTLMGSGSYSAERSKISIANSFGETFIFSSSNANVYYNQGFHNSELNNLVSVSNIPNTSLKVSIYPNPVQNEIFIKSKMEFSKVNIYSFEGKHAKSISIGGNQALDVSDLKTGLYLIQLISDNNIQYSGKFFKI